MNKPARYIGTGHWINQLPEQLPGIECIVHRFFTDQFVGVLRDESHLVLECSFRGKNYTAQLARDADGVFRGDFLATEGSRSWRGPVAGRLFRDAHGILFHGTWATDAGDSRRTFWADLVDGGSSQGISTPHSRFIDNGLEFMTITPPPDSIPEA